MLLIRPHLLRSALGAFALLVLGTAAGAQSTRRSAIGVDVAIGAAPGRGGEYLDRELATARAGLTVAFPFVPRSWIVAGADIEHAWWLRGRADDCAPRSDGACMRGFPAVRGWSTELGLRVAPAARVEMQALAGAGRYRTELGDTEREIRFSTARVLHGDVAVRVIGDVWLTVTGREIRLLDPIDGARLSVRPLTLGVRLISR